VFALYLYCQRFDFSFIYTWIWFERGSIGISLSFVVNYYKTNVLSSSVVIISHYYYSSFAVKMNIINSNARSSYLLATSVNET